MAGQPASSMRSHTTDFGRTHWDLAIIAMALATLGVATVLNAPSIVRAPLAIFTVFFVPGYVLTTALFPTTDSSLATLGRGENRENGITPLDRVVLGIGLSLSLVVLLGVTIDASPARISAESLLVGIALVTTVTIPAVIHRRRRRSDELTPLKSDEQRGGVRSSHGRGDLLRIAIALSVLLSAGAIAVSVGAVETDEGVTEFYFQGDAEGDTDTPAYLTNLTRDQAATVPLAVGNSEGRTITYSVVGQLQRAEQVDDGVVVHDRRTIDTREVTVPDGQTHTFNTSVTPRATGRHRLVYLIYQDDVPERPLTDNAYREIHLWIDVGEIPNGTDE